MYVSGTNRIKRLIIVVSTNCCVRDSVEVLFATRFRAQTIMSVRQRYNQSSNFIVVITQPRTSGHKSFAERMEDPWNEG